MIIKKFVAKSMNEALAQVKEELGEDAVILQSRKVEKGGLLKIGGAGSIEVTAATPDRNPPPKRQPVELDDEKKQALKRAAETIASGEELQRSEAERTPGAEGSLHSVRDGLNELRSSVQEMAAHLKYQNAPSLPPRLAQCWRDLIDSGVGERNANDLTQELFVNLSGEELEDEELIESHLHDLISDRFRTASLPLVGSRSQPLVVMLIGPTGVGKTTTLAKMATNRKILGGRHVVLISTDTYRVAAVEQLKTFASIAGLPMEVVYRPEELPKAIAAHQDADAILIDTAGRSQNDRDAMVDLKAFADAGRPDEVMLALAAGTRIEDQREMVRHFGVIPATRIIVTKVDEVTSAGHMLDLSQLIPKEWVYITTGQNVPDDIVQADPILLSVMVSRREYFDQLRANAFALPSAEDSTA